MVGTLQCDEICYSLNACLPVMFETGVLRKCEALTCCFSQVKMILGSVDSCYWASIGVCVCMCCVFITCCPPVYAHRQLCASESGQQI